MPIQTSVQTAAVPQATTAAQRFVRGAGIALAASAFVALSAHVSIPLGFTPVPMTMQPFAVILLGLVLAPGLSFAALCLYLLEGASGLPVFSPHGPGGIAQLFGATGGYLMAAPFAAALAGMIHRRGRSLFSALAGAAAADLTLLAMGTLWLGLWIHTGFHALLAAAVLPFLAGDAAKVVAAALCALALASFGRRSSQPQQ